MRSHRSPSSQRGAGGHGPDHERLIIAELCRHLPTMATAIRLVYEHVVEQQRAAGAQTCCRDANRWRNHDAARALTRREREVLDLVAEGLTNQEIADRLVVSADTVKNHVVHVCTKLGAKGRTDAAVRAVRMGLIA